MAATLKRNRLLRVSEVAEELGLSVSCINRWINHGLVLGGRKFVLPARRIGLLWMIDRDDLVQLIGEMNGD